MAKSIPTELLGPAAHKQIGWTKDRMLAECDSAIGRDFQIDKKSIDRVVKGTSKPQDRTRLVMLPISAAILNWSREAIATEVYMRGAYERYSEEIKVGATPSELEGYLIQLRLLTDDGSAGGAWNVAAASLFDADLRWDAVHLDGVSSLFGVAKEKVRQQCLTGYVLAFERFRDFVGKLSEGAFKLAPKADSLVAARAESMTAVAAEQIFNLALLNEKENWGLVIDDQGIPLTVEWASGLLLPQDKVDAFTGALYNYLPGEGWRRRIANNSAVLTLAIVCARIRSSKTPAAVLKVRAKEAVAVLERHSKGERVDLTSLPSALCLEQAGMITIKKDEQNAKVLAVKAARRKLKSVSAAAGAVLGLLGLFWQSAAPAHSGAADMARYQIENRLPLLRLAGPGGTRPTQMSAIGPGGGVATTLT
ncbi:hypothetical protein ACNJX9_39020 [Bradyrhizobium sp. DASA03076]|uniref:hypothetical protein n=1 Tax=Bradyrhizobium sp. BLXBL-03 TaxID=3395916 RepID=UPI003F6F96C1